MSKFQVLMLFFVTFTLQKRVHGNFTEISVEISSNYNSTEKSIKWKLQGNLTDESNNTTEIYLIDGITTNSTQTPSNNNTNTKNKTEISVSNSCDATIALMRNTIFMAVIWVGLIGNIIAFYILQTQTKKNVINVTLKALAIVDNIYLAGVLIIILFQHTEQLKPYSKTRNFFAHVTRLAELMSIWMVVLVGFIRYIAICKPMYVKVLCTKTKAILAMLILVACDLAVHVPIFTRDKSALPWSSRTFRIVYLGVCYYFLLRFAIPFFSLLYMNIQLSATTKRIHGQIEAFIHQGNRQELADVTRVIVAIVTVFLITNLPFVVYGILQIVGCIDQTLVMGLLNKCPMKYFMKGLLQLLMLINSSANFFVYFYLRKSFRAMLKGLLRRKLPSSRRTSASDNSVRTNSLNIQQM